MADIANILEEDAAYNFAFEKLGEFIIDILPNRAIFTDSANFPTSTTPFLVADIVSYTDYSGGMGQRPIYYEIADDGAETYVYKDKATIDLLAYIGAANSDLKKLRTMLNNKYKKFEHFGVHSGLVGVTDIGNVTDNKISVYESQEMRTGAILRIGLTYLYKVVDNYGEYINQINFTATTNSGDDSIVDEGSVI